MPDDVYRASEGWKGAVTLRNPTDHFIVYMSDNVHYMVIYGTGKFEIKERKL